jgi:hypothetical protein
MILLRITKGNVDSALLHQQAFLSAQ